MRTTVGEYTFKLEAIHNNLDDCDNLVPTEAFHALGALLSEQAALFVAELSVLRVPGELDD